MNFEAAMKMTGIAFAFGVLLWLGYVVRHAILLIFVSIIFAVVFLPCVRWVQRWRVRGWSPGRGTAILILLAILLGGLSVFLIFAVPPILHDARGLTNDLPNTLRVLQGKLEQLPFARLLARGFRHGQIGTWLQSAARHWLTALHGLASGLTALLTLAVLTAYFILDGERAFQWAMAMVADPERRRLAKALENGAQRMQRWLYGQFFLMLILGSSSAVVFGAMGIRYFYALAVFAGVANFVPILGPVATVVMATLIAALDSWEKVLGVWIFYAAYQQVESAFLTPRIMRKEVDLPGAAVIVALAIGGELAGLLGAIAAVPTAALVGTIMDEYLVRRPAAQFLPERAA